MPIIVINTHQDERNINYILLSVSNCGNGLAKNIRLSTNSDFPVTYILEPKETIPLKELGLFNYPFDLGTAQKFECILKYLPEDYEDLRRDNKLSFNIIVSYEDIQHQSYSYSFLVNLEIYHHLSFIIKKI